MSELQIDRLHLSRYHSSKLLETKVPFAQNTVEHIEPFCTVAMLEFFKIYVSVYCWRLASQIWNNFVATVQFVFPTDAATMGQ